MPVVEKGTVNKDAPNPSDLEAKHKAAEGQGREESKAKTDLGKPLIPGEDATHRGRDNPMGVKAKEGCLEKKEVVKLATLVLHDVRPQPRADEIEDVLDQLRLTDKEFSDPEAVKTEAKALLKKVRPEEAEKAEATRADHAPSQPPGSPASSPNPAV